ncbi:DUF2254 domain-containing protein [Dethiothermospora halolimnae]|uniref:DUF2254 domain-containing protein n=1 Tax=Dethiothermospora halolimnae TaxID=3114390 RepID=UPI003CCC2EE3
MFKKLIFKLKNKIWFVPGYYSLLSSILAAISIIIDNKYIYNFQGVIPSLLMTRVDLAETILSTLAAALLTMMTITFSTIMVVLTTYSSQFSPRTLEDFINDRTTLRFLGIFMGGFIYCILGLSFIKNNDNDKLVLSSGISVIIAIICLSFFVYFIHHISISIQVNRLIDRLGEDILKLVKKIETSNNSDDRIQSEPPKNIDKLNENKRIAIFSEKVGYIQLIDDIGLLNLAINKNVLIRVEKMVGDYVTTNSNIISIWNNKGNIDEKEFLKYITLGSQRNMLWDIEFGLQKIVEVALKALSPGINDPNTAIKCIYKLGMILTKIGGANLENTYYYGEDGRLRLIFEDKSFNQLLYKTFYQLRHYSSSDVSVMSSMLDALILIAQENKKPLKDKVWDFSGYIIGGFKSDVLEPLDKDYINSKIRRLAYLTGNLGAVKYIE